MLSNPWHCSKCSLPHTWVSLALSWTAAAFLCPQHQGAEGVATEPTGVTSHYWSVSEEEIPFSWVPTSSRYWQELSGQQVRVLTKHTLSQKKPTSNQLSFSWGMNSTLPLPLRCRPLLSGLGCGKLPDTRGRQTLETLQRPCKMLLHNVHHLSLLIPPQGIRVVLRIVKINSWGRLTPPCLQEPLHRALALQKDWTCWASPWVLLLSTDLP